MYNLKGEQVEKLKSIILEDDSTEYGGVAFVGETLEDFLASTGEWIYGVDDITPQKINDSLVSCGIKPINENVLREIFSEHVYLVRGFYDMNIGGDEEIVIEIYGKEEDARERCMELISNWKDSYPDAKGRCTDWIESEYSLYAFHDSTWNVDISYCKKTVL